MTKKRKTNQINKHAIVMKIKRNFIAFNKNVQNYILQKKIVKSNINIYEA